MAINVVAVGCCNTSGALSLELEYNLERRLLLDFGDSRLHARSRAHPTRSTDSASHAT